MKEFAYLLFKQQKMKWYGPTQFALFRANLGIYLAIHYFQLLPVSTEMFSNEGVIKNASSLPSYGKVPVILFKYDDPQSVTLFLSSLVACSILFTFGIYRRLCSLWLYYGWMCLLNRNPLISNPSIGYIGWILLACATIPTGERMGFLLSKEEREQEANDESNVRKNATFSGVWEMPDIIYTGFVIIVGVSYTVSGLHKLNCATWLDGTALYYVLTSPVARQNFIVEFILSDMTYVKIMSWGSLFLEISSLFLGTFYRTRKYYWFMYIGFHVGILATVNFVDLTFGMIVAHLFTFDASWFNFTRWLVEEYDHNRREIQEFDINHTDNFNLKPMSTNIKEGVEHIVADIKESVTISVASSIESITHIKDSLHDLSHGKSHNLDKNIDKSLESSSHNMLSWVTYSLLIVAIAIMFRSKGDMWTSLNRLTELTIDMYWGFAFLIAVLGALMVFERIFPDQELKHVPGWWKYVILINVFQLFAVVLANFTWENWLTHTDYYSSTTQFHLKDHVNSFWGGLIAYVVHQWFFYWFHMARHEIYVLWILLHQFHHSPSRIETITSFYKHPLEIIIDSQLMAILLYAVLGVSKESSIWLSIYAAIGEYVYHMNIKTPRILGYMFQRPESHRCHHRRSKRLNCPNYSDLPIYDVLGGTYENPEYMNEPTGFSPHTEIRRIDMLLFKDVITGVYQNISTYKKFKKVCIRYTWYALAIWGALNSVAFLVHYDGFREICFITASSPLPLVFSAFNGHETYSTGFNITVTYKNGTKIHSLLDANLYDRMHGSYNRRNVYGAVFTHGPFFDTNGLITIRQNILYHAVCVPGSLINEFGFSGDVENMHVDVYARAEQNKQVGKLDISCAAA
jgi:sterol desaturase/sphingolipid hydroxylase (fatty acid hydroxylase superfamily)